MLRATKAKKSCVELAFGCLLSLTLACVLHKNLILLKINVCRLILPKELLDLVLVFMAGPSPSNNLLRSMLTSLRLRYQSL